MRSVRRRTSVLLQTCMRSRLQHARRRRQPNQAAFTLLELMVVMVIMCIAMAVLLPRLGGQLTSSTLRAAVQDLGALAWTARFRAADTGAPHVLVLNRAAGEMRLLGAGGSGVVSFKRLPSKVSVDRMELKGRRVDGEKLRVTFYPQGTATPARLRLRADNKESMNVAISGADGAVHAQ